MLVPGPCHHLVVPVAPRASIADTDRAHFDVGVDGAHRLAELKKPVMVSRALDVLGPVAGPCVFPTPRTRSAGPPTARRRRSRCRSPNSESRPLRGGRARPGAAPSARPSTSRGHSGPCRSARVSPTSPLKNATKAAASSAVPLIETVHIPGSPVRSSSPRYSDGRIAQCQSHRSGSPARTRASRRRRSSSRRASESCWRQSRAEGPSPPRRS